LTGVPIEYAKSLSELTAGQATFSETVTETELESSEKVEERKKKKKKGASVKETPNPEKTKE